MIEKSKVGLYFIAFLISLFLYSCTPLINSSSDLFMVEQEFRKIFKNTSVLKVESTKIPGMFRIYYGGNFSGSVYFFPSEKVIFIGEVFIFDPGGLFSGAEAVH